MSGKTLNILEIMTCLAIMIMFAGCMSLNNNVSSSTATPPDPESGIVTWTEKMNARDIAGLYSLAPSKIRNQVSLDQFLNANSDNPLLESGKTITGYEIINKTSNISVADIRAVVFLRQTMSANSTLNETIPIFLHFEERYEDGQWKVWTGSWS